MATAREHYDQHLGPVYAWMVGDLEAALARSRAQLAELLPLDLAGAQAVDLGCGHGLQALPLLERGASVLALDTCAPLLAALRSAAGDRPAQVVEDDLLRFRVHLARPARAIVCMGDTLTHLADRAQVRALFAEAAAALEPGGLLALTFRDYSVERRGEERFIPVRADAERILTCFLEFAPEHVEVHDLLHQRGPQGWAQQVSSYRKLRLAPSWVEAELGAAGLRLARSGVERGLASVVAARP